MFRNLVILLTTAPLAACQSFSFASPPVRKDIQIARYDEVDCTAIPKTRATNGGTIEISPNVAGAMTLIDNFTLAYECAEQDLANGRQIFEVPAFLAAAAGLVGPAAFSFSAKDVLKLGAAGTVVGAGNTYYAPKAKAGFVSSALRAVYCVQTEAVGISYFKHKEEEKPEEDGTKDLREALDALIAERKLLGEMRAAEGADGKAVSLLAANAMQVREVTDALARNLVARAEEASDDSVSIDAEAQYFRMVGSSLGVINTILGERLRDAGSTDTKALFEELKRLSAESSEADEESEDAEDELKLYSERNLVAPKALRKKAIDLENEALQPKLQACVLQARL